MQRPLTDMSAYHAGQCVRYSPRATAGSGELRVAADGRPTNTGVSR